MENRDSKHNKKQLLIDNLYNFLQNQNGQELQLKPQQYDVDPNQKDDFSLIAKDGDLEEYKKDYSSRIDKQILIISQNIIGSLFGLNNQKFTAFMSRYDVWGFDLTMQQFIINFYLVVKTDNMLRQFVLSHMQKIIKTARDVMQKYLITHMNEFRFRETRTDYNKKKLMDQAKAAKVDLNEKVKDKDLNPTGKEEKETGQAAAYEEPPIVVGQAAEGEGGVPPIQPFNPEGGETEGGVPSILSMDDMMNMSEQELNNITTSPEGTIPPIQPMNNEVGTIPPINQEPIYTAPPKEGEEEQQTEDEKEMEQQILANLRQEHPGLQRGLTNNG